MSSLTSASAFHNLERKRRDAWAPSRQIMRMLGATASTSAPERPRKSSPLSTSSLAASTHSISTLRKMISAVVSSSLHNRLISRTVASVMASCPVPKSFATPSKPVLKAISGEQHANRNINRWRLSALIKDMLSAVASALNDISLTALSKQLIISFCSADIDLVVMLSSVLDSCPTWACRQNHSALRRP